MRKRKASLVYLTYFAFYIFFLLVFHPFFSRCIIKNDHQITTEMIIKMRWYLPASRTQNSPRCISLYFAGPVKHATGDDPIRESTCSLPCLKYHDLISRRHSIPSSASSLLLLQSRSCRDHFIRWPVSLRSESLPFGSDCVQVIILNGHGRLGKMARGGGE